MIGSMRRFRPSPEGRSARVVLHVGAPLTGAGFLRETLTRNRRRLARSGILYPAGHVGGSTGHRDAVLDVLDLALPGGNSTAGAWERLTQTARDWRRGTVVISHELLADADEDQVGRVVEGFVGADVHVVYVARDLARQVPLAWQEWVRNGGVATFEGYVGRLARRDGHRLSRVFWRSHDIPDVLTRWAAAVPRERIHLVTVPQGPDPDRTVWARFAEVAGIDPTRARVGVDAGRALDAMPATESLRLLNVAGALGLPRDVLGRIAGPAPALSEDHAPWVHDECERATREIECAGYDVVGSLDDLRPDPASWATDPGQSSAALEDVVGAQTALLRAVLDR